MKEETVFTVKPWKQSINDRRPRLHAGPLQTRAHTFLTASLRITPGRTCAAPDHRRRYISMSSTSHSSNITVCIRMNYGRKSDHRVEENMQHIQKRRCINMKKKKNDLGSVSYSVICDETAPSMSGNALRLVRVSSPAADVHWAKTVGSHSAWRTPPPAESVSGPHYWFKGSCSCQLMNFASHSMDNDHLSPFPTALQHTQWHVEHFGSTLRVRNASFNALLSRSQTAPKSQARFEGLLEDVCQCKQTDVDGRTFN